MLRDYPLAFLPEFLGRYSGLHLKDATKIVIRFESQVVRDLLNLEGGGFQLILGLFDFHEQKILEWRKARLLLEVRPEF